MAGENTPVRAWAAKVDGEILTITIDEDHTQTRLRWDEIRRLSLYWRSKSGKIVPVEIREITNE